jgi:hypothetical protein
MPALALHLAADARRRFGIIAWAAASNRAAAALLAGDAGEAKRWNDVADLVAGAPVQTPNVFAA